jgi:anti-sigma regulatory factor (Ser/Thr protein kinase)
MQREERTFELDSGQVGSARRFAAAVLQDWGCDKDDVMLAVGELASNAVLHARTRFRVSLSRRGDRVTLEVSDLNPRLPVAAEPPHGALSGRGLMLVQAVSEAWGVRTDSSDGKSIWAEFTLPANERR